MPRPSRIVPVIRWTHAIGITFRLLAPTVTATAATAHRPSVPPANLAAHYDPFLVFAAVIWVMSPHSARNTMAKLAALTRQNVGTRPAIRAASEPS